jgi:DNA-directed RNA polymerase subunit omega
MIFKEFQSLVDKAGSRYGLIISVTKRARAIKDGEAPLVNTNFEKTVSIATKEFIDGKVTIKKTEE